MSAHVYSRHESGLLLAEHGADERTVAAELRSLDRGLRLTWEIDHETGRQVWNVHKVVSPDRPAVQILTWRENGTGNPLPLTSRIVEEVKRLRAVDTMKQIDEHNQRLRNRAREQSRTDALDIAAEHAPYINRGRVQITTSDVSRKRSWLRNRHLKGDR